jgi:uncharacterized membrane protein
VIAIAVVGPALSFAFDESQTSTFGLAVVLSTIALAWNYAFNFWLDISPAAAFVANLLLLVFFFVYAIAFTWAFDRIFGLPASAVEKDPKAVEA